jgi:hypothetical protein
MFNGWTGTPAKLLRKTPAARSLDWRLANNPKRAEPLPVNMARQAPNFSNFPFIDFS